MSKSDLTGAGPFSLDSPQLAAGEVWHIDLPNMRYEGKKAYFRKFLPFDIAQITNQSDTENVKVTYNGIYDDIVVNNAVETFDRQGVRRAKVKNIGGSSIPAGTIVASFKKEPYDADDAARENRNKPWLEKAADDIIPGGVPW